MFKCTSAQVLTQWQSKRDSLAKEQCGFASKHTTSAGNLHAKTTQKHTTWWRKINTWHTIPLLVPTKQSRKRTFAKMARHSAACANQFVKMIAKKHTTWWQKTKLRVCLHYPLLHHQNVPCATIPNAPNGQFYKKWKVAIDEWANQWYNSYINEVNHV